MTETERKRLEAVEDRLNHLQNAARLMQEEITKLHTAYEGHQRIFEETLAAARALPVPKPVN